MSLYEKLFELQKSIDVIGKDGENKSDKYDYVSSSGILKIVRPKMDELGLLLMMKAVDAKLHEGVTRSGTARFTTEVHYEFTWHDIETGEQLTIPWYAQGDDLAGPKGPGKAAAYAEKTFLLKQFHFPTDKDDPDNDGRTQSGELKVKGTAAQAELNEMFRADITAMLSEVFGGDEESIKAALLASTKNEARGYAGVDNVAAIGEKALPVVYSKVSKSYEKRMGKKFERSNV